MNNESNQQFLPIYFVESIKKRQSDFNNKNVILDEKEKYVADKLQEILLKEFESIIDKRKSELIDMDFMELRIWAPDKLCAIMKIYEHLMQEYSVFFQIKSSSGLFCLCPNKLFYIALVINREVF